MSNVNVVRNRVYAGGLALLVFGFATFPLYLQRAQPKNLTRSATPLPGHAIMRGAYVNSGSRDAGPDPDWDMTKGQHRGKSNFNPSESDVAAARAEYLARRAALNLPPPKPPRGTPAAADGS